MFSFIKKNFAIIFIIIFIIIFSIFNKDEFIKNYENKVSNIEQNINLKNELSNFELNKIKKIDNLQFFYTPYKKLLDKFVYKIDNAKKRVYIEVYMLTEKRIQQALVNAKNRWVEVKVLLEKNPYKSININNKAFNLLQSSWVNIKWSNSDLYALNHSKFFIVDDLLIISSWNLTYSTFAFNRDLFLFTSDKNILDKYLKIFFWDFSWVKNIVYNNNLVLSPEYSRDKFAKMFDWARDNLDLYFQYLEDKSLENILIEKANSWVKIRIIVSENYWKDKQEEIKKLEKKWIQVSSLKSSKMHSKAILIDRKYLFIWSVNFSSYSLDKNRETGLIFTNNDVIQKFSKLFSQDFANK